MSNLERNIYHEPVRSRDSPFNVSQFDFFFKLELPKKRKEREIIERDCLGRIIHSIVPPQVV